MNRIYGVLIRPVVAFMLCLGMVAATGTGASAAVGRASSGTRVTLSQPAHVGNSGLGVVAASQPRPVDRSRHGLTSSKHTKKTTHHHKHKKTKKKNHHKKKHKKKHHHKHKKSKKKHHHKKKHKKKHHHKHKKK